VKTVTIVLSDSESYNLDRLKQGHGYDPGRQPASRHADSNLAAAGEGGSSGLFTITRTGNTNDALNVRFAVGGSAIE